MVENLRKVAVHAVSPQLVEKQLQAHFFNLTENRSQFKKSELDKNLIVYTLFEGSKMTVITEVPHVPDLVPEDFKYFINNWVDCAAALNPLIESVEILEPVDGYGTGRTIAVCPWPLSKRLMYSARYPCLDFKPNHHIFIMSEKGSEPRIVFTETDAKTYALAKLYVAGWSFAPIIDSNNAVIGTTILYVQCADAGGNVPQAVQNLAGPN